MLHRNPYFARFLPPPRRKPECPEGQVRVGGKCVPTTIKTPPQPNPGLCKGGWKCATGEVCTCANAWNNGAPAGCYCIAKKIKAKGTALVASQFFRNPAFPAPRGTRGRVGAAWTPAQVRAWYRNRRPI